jgi:tetratricopeptide (TPR) repeat protein
MRPLAGRFWWSFYESDATWENFITRALAYAARRPLSEIEKLPFPEREDGLLAILDTHPLLLVLDGLERVLVAYARGDAPYLGDAEVARDIPASSPRHPLRRTTDPRAGAFLRELLGVRATRALASSRLFPADIENVAGDPLPGAFRHRLSGLTDDDALELWRAFGARAARESLLPLVERIGRHPLLLQVLAGEVARFREAPGDFDAWSRANPQFDPFSLEIADTAGARSHVLAYALRGLPAAEARTLHVLAGFRMPVGFATIKALLLRDRGEERDPAKVPFGDLVALDQALTDLEDRGLVGWDPRANRYDLHPIVRGVVWSELAEEGRCDVHETLRAHFAAVPMIEEWTEVESLGDLTPAIELFHSLIGLGRYEDAFRLYCDRLEEAAVYRLSATRQRVELVERFLPDGAEAPPRLSGESDQGWLLNSLAAAYHSSGRPRDAAVFFRRAEAIHRHLRDPRNLAVALANLSSSLLLSGSLRAAVGAAAEALQLARELERAFVEGHSLWRLGNAFTARGSTGEAERALSRSLRSWIARSNRQAEGVVSASLAEVDLRKADPAAARRRADRAWGLAGIKRLEGDFIRAARLQGLSALRLGDLSTADERLQHALARARACDLVDEQLPALVALADLRLRQGDPIHSRELLDQLWDPAERGPYPFFHADASNLLAEIEREAGNRAAAAEAASRAYRLAWCDGPPFAYHWGLDAAKAHLAALGAVEPPMPPFDPAKFDPMPEVEIDPPDEFGAARAEPDPPP